MRAQHVLSAALVLGLSAAAAGQDHGAHDVTKPNLVLHQMVEGMPKDEKQSVRVMTASFKPGDKTVFARLREEVDRGQKMASVTGRVEGWGGHFPPFLKGAPKKPRVILVEGFAPAK